MTTIRTATIAHRLILSAVAVLPLACSWSSAPSDDNGGAGGSAPANVAGSSGSGASAAGRSGSGGSAAGGSGGSAAGGSGGSAAGGSGGSAAGGSGGSAAGGSGGSAGAAGSSGTGVTGISFLNGYATGNGFKGFWYTFKDPGGSTITPVCDEAGLQPCFSMAGNNLCVSGVGAQVKDMEYSKYWGAGLGWNLNQGDTEPNPAGTVSLAGKTALSVNIQMKTNSPLRVKFKVAGDMTEYCTNLRPGANSVPFNTITKECWEPGGMPLPSGVTVEALQLQVPTVETATTPFDFCITQLSMQ